MLASLLCPYDDDAPALIGGSTSWIGKNMILRYVVDGYDYLEIVEWLDLGLCSCCVN